MLSVAREVAPAAASRAELLEAMRRFLLPSDKTEDMVVLDPIDSPGFGSSDLFFADRNKDRFFVARLALPREEDGFVMSSLAYYYWLGDLLRAGLPLREGQQREELQMHLFSTRFPDALPRVIGHLDHGEHIHTIEYHVLRAERLDGLAVHFRPAYETDIFASSAPGHSLARSRETPPSRAEMTPSSDATRQELAEFNRLKKLYYP